jgi:glutamine synthetase
MKADINSFRETSYMNNNKKQLLFFSDLNCNGQPILYNPRCLLKKSIEDFNKLNLDIFPKIQSEFNFCIFEGNYKNNENNLEKIIPITEHSNSFNTLYKNKFEDFFKKIKNALKTSNIGYEGIKGDEAEGQFRILISASDPVEFCDNIVLMKLVI